MKELCYLGTVISSLNEDFVLKTIIIYEDGSIESVGQ